MLSRHRDPYRDVPADRGGRFPKVFASEKLLRYLGLMASEYSSGSQRRQGGITKTGNRHLRRLLIEAAWHARHRPNVGERLTKTRLGQPEWIVRLTNKAMERLYRRYHRLVARGKHKNKVVTAIARELAGFIWASQVHQAA